MKVQTSQELELDLAKIRHILSKHSLSPEMLPGLLSNPSFGVPVSIFRSRAGPLGALVCFLKQKGLRFSDIARLLSRDQRTIWATYNKYPNKQGLELDYSLCMPVELFSDRRLSIMEALVYYLKSVNNLRLIEIATLLSRSNKTIWCFYSRAKKNAQ
jgi:hypothetical protein